jgi:hypothetical protein
MPVRIQKVTNANYGMIDVFRRIPEPYRNDVFTCW